MKRLLVFLTLLIISIFVNGQENQVDNLINEGIALHDNGEYKKAIEKYMEAVNIDPNSSLAYYEISYSYFSLKDYKNVEKYSKKAIENKNGYEFDSYILYGTALDMQGKTRKSIRVYEAALKDYDHYLLHYNHAVSCFNIGNLDKAYESAINAIIKNTLHSNSHLLLSKIMEKKGSRIKTVLPLYFFLLIEPNSPQSSSAYDMLISKLDYGIEKRSEKNIDIAVLVNDSDDSDFQAAEMMISFSRASKYTEKNADKSEMELFAENNELIFSVLAKLKKDNIGFWWEFYVPFFYGIVHNEHTETYSYYISQSSGKQEVDDWLESHKEELENFLNWINK